MSKELYVSSTPHQTKVALVENGQLAEVYFERENEYTLAGSIYKGRVTRVLPGMQSAFVDIGLERDAFLYVSDFFEIEEEDEAFEPIPVAARPFEIKPQAAPEPVEMAPPERDQPPIEDAVAEQVETEAAAGEGEIRSNGNGEAQPQSEARENSEESGRWRSRRRRRGGRGRVIPESKYARPERDSAPQAEAYEPIILPGESIAKYRRGHPPAGATGQVAATSGEQNRAYQHNSGRQEAEAEAHVHTEAEAEASGSLSSAPAGDRKTAEQSAPAREESAEHAATLSGAGESHTYRDRREPEQEQSDSGDEHNGDKREQERRYEQMNVAAIFGGMAADEPTRHAFAEEEEQQHGGWDSEHEETIESREAGEPTEPSLAAGRTSDAPPFPSSSAPVDYRNAPAGAFEEEVMESEEEEDLPHPAEVLFEPEEYEELEEETLEPEVGEELTEAVEESDEERELIESYEAQEPEEAAGPTVIEGGYSGPDEPEEGQAQLRGPSGTAAFQRGTAPDYARHRRGRRGGRGMRTRREQVRQAVAIADVLKEGQEVLVQIAKEPIGKKGARITSHIALPGRFLVYMPTVNHVGVSRKISSDEERQRLKRIVMSEREDGHGGFIVRTAAANVSEHDLRIDIKFLKSLWHDIRTRAEEAKPPALIYHDLNLVERTLRDLVTSDFGAIWVDTEQEYERVLRFVNRFQPSLLRRVKLYTRETPLFEQFGVEEEVNKALKPKVWLKSGGYIVINQTEALVAIDINTGKYVGKTSRLEDTIFKTNVDAIKEIVRQIRLRDLGGIIVIDFIDMDERRNRQKVMQALEEELQNDRAPSKVLQFNDFGLVAITRKRVKQSLERTLGTSCPYCTGSGFVKSPATVCNEIYVEMRKMRREMSGNVILRVNPEVAKELKANNGRWLNVMEELTGCNVIVKSDPAVHQEQFDM